MRKILRNNGLTIVLVLCLTLFLVGQIVAGMLDYNEDQRTHGQPEVGVISYLATPHFLEATTENWESEFLQMFAFAILTACLYQKGSAESRDPDKDEEPTKRNKKDAPWPVRKGGIVLKLYENSLSLIFLLLFLMSFTLHAISGAREYNQNQLEHGNTQQVSAIEYLGTSRFWFESFQNWQSEFLAVAAMVVFSIFLRQKGSPESKPVDAPHSQTGSD
ncbi:MAG TPA: DUF6766 family protein [Pyrinomonadaceae bacterium]|nr:DUF6766 family protein [Pyrinomonadaceae bacterium]